MAFLEQSQDFYAAAGGRLAANPLLLYYSFLNLGKAILKLRMPASTLDRAVHGLSTKHAGTTGEELADSVVEWYPTGAGPRSVFVELMNALGYPLPPGVRAISVTALLPQVVVGHRLWRHSSRANRERFLPLTHVDFIDDTAAKLAWIRLFIRLADLPRYGMTWRGLLRDARLGPTFRRVQFDELDSGEGCLELARRRAYTDRPSDIVPDLVQTLRPVAWRMATTVPAEGFRKYYVHLTPPGDVRLPQIAAMWALLFYFGSIVRYRPYAFDSVLAGQYGAFVAEFISAQPEQLLYLLASEMMQKEVVKPTIV